MSHAAPDMSTQKEASSALALGDCSALKRYAEGWCDGKYFCIQVAETETLKQLKRHFRETVGHDRIQVLRWYHA